MTWPGPIQVRGSIVLAVAVAALITATGYTIDSLVGEPDTKALGPGDVTVEIDIHHSAFAPDQLTVVEGTRVRFLVDNGDPIHHELITGEPEVHRRHADGTEARHPSVPGEVSVGPNDTAVTTFTFDTPGVYEFACHLPGHYEYGMRGEIEVVAGD
jgi:uncharacterized cupredoxin-like copper-binding protein